jgi:hypothetical protein
VTVSVNFTDHLLDRWKDGEKARLLRAAELFGRVWGSQEFKDKVLAIPSLNWHIGSTDESTDPAKITGRDLYGKLLSVTNITMNLERSANPLRDETADSAGHSTNFRSWWVDDATVYDLSNTLSHEYTHYDQTGSSWDKGYTVKKECVSYGIGALTENLSAGCIRCDDDPTI